MVPAQARVSVAPSATLARGSTYAWAPVPAVGYGTIDPEITNPITAERLRRLTESTLTSRGYRQVADLGEADLLVSYTIILVPEDVDSYRPEARHEMRGTLALDLTERETGRLVWRATSDKRVTGNDTSEKKLTALLRKMTKSLPQR
jgi:hypothetical protein